MASEQLGKVVHYLRTVVGPPDEGALTDGRLLERFLAQRDEEAFATIVQRHGPMVLGVCRRVLEDGHEAEDVFQATFLVLARKAASIRNRSSLGSWLYGVAYRTAQRARAVAAKRHARERQADDMFLPDPAAEAAWRELRPLLDAELERLPEKYRAPLVLCYLEGKSNAEAAEQLGWTKGTVSGRLARARDLLRGRLQRRGVSLSSVLLVSLLSANGAAGLPPALTAVTVKAATLAAAGQAAAAGLVSCQAAALVEGVLQTMVVNKAKLGAVLLAATLFTAGASAIVYRACASEPGGIEAARQGQQEIDPAKLRAENERLRRELELARQELKKAQQEILELKRDAQLQRARADAEALRREAEARLAVAEAQKALVEANAQRAKEAQEAAEKERQAAERARSINNLKHLAVAFHNYHEVHGHLPPAAIYSKDGKPLLSWRVLLLPYLEEAPLYQQFKLDEAWDSPHNKKLLAKMPKVFTVGGKAADTTIYQVFTGKGTLFEGRKGIQFKDILDGTSNTILMTEAARPVPWTKPEDIPYDATKPLPKVGGLWPDAFHIALADGSVHTVRPNFDERTFHLAITRADGQVIDLGKLNAPK